MLTRAAFLLAALLTLIAGYYVVERIRGEATWQSYQADARARGEKLTLADFVPPAIPDNRNFAAIPFFEDSFKARPPKEPLTLLSDDSAHQPLLGSPTKGEAIDLQKWQAYFVGKKMVPAASDNPAADVLKALDQYAPELEQLRVAGLRPDSRFPVDYADLFAAPLPHLRMVQCAARLYVLRMAAHLAVGDSPAAYQDFRGGLRLYDALEKEPTAITGVVRLSFLAIQENVVTGGIIHRQWGDPELAKVITDLSRVRLMDDYAFCLGGERALQNAMYERLLGPKAHEIIELMFGESGFGARPRTALEKLGVHLLPRIYPHGWVRLSQTRANHYFDVMLGSVTQDPPRVFLNRPGSELLASPASFGPLDRMRYLFFFAFAPFLQGFQHRYAYGQTCLDETRLACALERYRLAHGSYPNSLDALAGAYLPQVPRDVMTGEPLHYRLESDGGFTIYSVGWNLQDDGGKYVKQESANNQPDWVWAVRPQ